MVEPHPGHGASGTPVVDHGRVPGDLFGAHVCRRLASGLPPVSVELSPIQYPQRVHWARGHRLSKRVRLLWRECRAIPYSISRFLPCGHQCGVCNVLHLLAVVWNISLAA